MFSLKTCLIFFHKYEKLQEKNFTWCKTEGGRPIIGSVKDSRSQKRYLRSNNKVALTTTLAETDIAWLKDGLCEDHLVLKFDMPNSDLFLHFYIL